VIYLAGGVLFGLLAGILLAVLRDRRDDRVRNAAELEYGLGAPVIAESPSTESGSRLGQPAAIAADRSAEADAYRTVTTTVTADSADSRIVLLCGTGQEGFSLAPLNLAATFATQGLQTVIAGPRQAVEPAIDLLEVPGPSGPQAARLADQLAPSATLPLLSVLSLGDEVSLGATLRANGDRLDDVLAGADMIILDGVNIELPSTSLRLAQLADEAVVVAYRNRSTHADIERLARQLDHVNTTVLGGVLLTPRSGLRAKLHRRNSDSAGRRRGTAAHREPHPTAASRLDQPAAEQVPPTAEQVLPNAGVSSSAPPDAPTGPIGIPRSGMVANGSASAYPSSHDLGSDLESELGSDRAAAGHPARPAPARKS
ncbi:MAG TPA: hypothetical protein VF714_11035, partial [Jatrophihabitans sp.]|jgi:Mrp family chromosome partitioning ATPase